MSRSVDTTPKIVPLPETVSGFYSVPLVLGTPRRPGVRSLIPFRSLPKCMKAADGEGVEGFLLPSGLTRWQDPIPLHPRFIGKTRGNCQCYSALPTIPLKALLRRGATASLNALRLTKYVSVGS